MEFKLKMPTFAKKVETKEKKEGNNFLTTEQLTGFKSIEEKVDSGILKTMEQEKLLAVWGKIQKIASVAAVFAVAASGVALSAYETVIHHGDITSAGLQIAIGAAIALIAAAAGSTMLQKE